MADLSLPWWLGPRKEPWEALLAGVQTGTAVRSNNLRAQQMMMESAQNLRREETATELKLLDLKQEDFRNQIALETFQAKNELEKHRVNGISAMMDMVSQHTKDKRLTDPLAISEFHSLAAEWPQIPNELYNSVYDNNYKAAMDRDERAKGLSGKDIPSAIQQFNMDKDYANKITAKSAELSAEQDPARKEALKSELDTLTKERERFGLFAGIPTEPGKLEFKTTIAPSGKVITYHTGPKGQINILKEYDTSRIKDQLKLAQFNAKVRSIMKMEEDYDPYVLTKDGKGIDRDKVHALIEEAREEAESTGPTSKKSTVPAKPGAQYRFDEKTRKAVEIK